MASLNMSSLNDDLRIRAAWLYYKEGMTQDQVARELGTTRTKVLRMLAAARQDGSVQVRIISKLSRSVELERELERKFGLERALIIPAPTNPDMVHEMVGMILGEYLTDSLRENMTIGLGWGRTLNYCLNAISPQQLAGLSIVSLLGGLTRVSRANPAELAWRVGDRLSAQSFLIAAPVFAPDEQTRRALLVHAGIDEVFRRAENLDMAVISVGDFSSTSIFKQYQLWEEKEIDSLQKTGAVGDVLFHAIDAEGQILDHEINRRVIAVHPHSLKSARKIVLASGGMSKSVCFPAAMKLLKPHVIVTDEELGESLLAGSSYAD